MQFAADRHHVAVQKPGLFSLIRLIDRRFRAGIDRNLGALDLNAREFELLRQVREGDTASAGHLARRCGVTRQAVHKALDSLIALGLVDRWQRGSRADTVVALTPLGLAVLDDADQRTAGFRDAVLQRFGPRQEAALQTLLEELAAALDLAEKRPDLGDR